jgi:radical SAM superfamily enzyme YgiQ (UPF0313 family)
MDDIHLCIPPISFSSYPLVTVPLLASICNQKGYSVSVGDANIEFLNFFLNEKKETIQEELKSGKYDDFKFYEVVNRYFDLSLATERNYPPNDIHRAEITYSLLLHSKFTEDWVNRFRKYPSKILGFSITSFLSGKWAIEAAKRIKDLKKNIFIVLGGAFFKDKETAYEIISNFSWIDAIVIGEGEDSLIEILEKYNGIADDLKNVKGIVIRLQNGEIKINESRPPLMDLDRLPFPDYSYLSIDQYINFRINTRMLPIFGSRGCIGRCSFCGEKDIYRARSPENIIREMKYQAKEYKIKIFRFCDNLLNADIEWLERLSDLLIGENLDIIWGGNARINIKMTSSLLKKMYQSGCRFLWYGIESASPRILKIMRKDINIEEASEVLKTTKEAGIFTLTFWIANFPQETWEDAKKTADFLKKNCKYIDSARFATYILTKDSHMYQNPGKYGLIIKQTNDTTDLDWEVTDTVDSFRFLQRIAKKQVGRTQSIFLEPYKFLGRI